MSDEGETPLEQIAAGVTIGAILTVAFGLLALGVSWFWIVFPIGFAGVLPAVMGLVKLYERRQEQAAPEEDEDPLEALRERYARGELSDTEFERKLDRLLETESPADAHRFERRDGDEMGSDTKKGASESTEELDKNLE
ncbi:SHOCT domain-containing protein [Halobacteria archaeon AArc-curdl1]|uniref:SHOCT domain-containing protein n=1 Tax=Natronosalvus hydrolyticus TaxID=2979988 RepID=A0AAP2Z5A2_9EURY|nr:SHOCT domain-containing protein [Halobacteria archaeon AArc-curdl1]